VNKIDKKFVVKHAIYYVSKKRVIKDETCWYKHEGTISVNFLASSVLLNGYHEN